MKSFLRNCSGRYRLVSAGVGAISIFLLMVGALFADGPILHEELWEGHVWQRLPFSARTFEAPPDVAQVEVIAEWGWSGLPEQHQTNEIHKVRLPDNRIIECTDYGDEELAGQWIRCGSETFAWSGNLDMEVVFTGDSSSPGSHLFRVTVRWMSGPPRSGMDGLNKVCLLSGPLAEAEFELRGLPDFVQVTDAQLVSGQDGQVWAAVNWLGGPERVTGQFCEISPPPGFALPAEPCVDATFLNGSTSFPADPTTVVNYLDTPLICNSVDCGIPEDAQLPAAGIEVDISVDAELCAFYRIVAGADHDQIVADKQLGSQFSDVHIYPNVDYQAQVSNDGVTWSKAGCEFKFASAEVEEVAACTMSTTQDETGYTMVTLDAMDQQGRSVGIEAWKADSNFGFTYDEPMPVKMLPVPVEFPERAGNYWVQFWVSASDQWLGGNACRMEHHTGKTTSSQYQDFVGAVAFGMHTPVVEAGKECFDGPQSIMYNVEYFAEADQGEVVFRFNGQEQSNVTTSIFNGGTFAQVTSEDGRHTTTFAEGVTKLIAYSNGAEQACIFQTNDGPDTRWFHPLDQPFEYKYPFELELYGPPNTSDLLMYGDLTQPVHYDRQGVATVSLVYDQPGLVAVYPVSNVDAVDWVTVDQLTYPQAAAETARYRFGDTGLYHYRIIDEAGKLVAGPTRSEYLVFEAEPGLTYAAQLVYPATSLYVGLSDDMQFAHTPYWTMPIDGRYEHDFEFHMDYHRLDDPDMGDDHIRGDVVVDALYLLNGTTSVEQQYPYGRHDNVLPGVTLVGIPDASMVAFCQRPGVHEVAYWGGWENESYYLPNRGVIYDRDLYDSWTHEQHGDCIDAANRVNMELARQGLRTDHTFQHYGPQSQGYQMSQLHIWSPYNLAGMRPPHVGQILKPGKVLPYYQSPEDMLFWGWDLAEGGLMEGIDCQAYLTALGPVEYGDQTGLHPPSRY